LTTFNYYIAVATLLSTGLAASFKSDFGIPYLGVACGFLLMFFSFVFSKLDVRNSDLIKGAENALKFFEERSLLRDEGDIPHRAKRFLREEYDSSLLKESRTWKIWRNHYSYSDCFKLVFLAFAACGLVGGGLSVYFLIRSSLVTLYRFI
jgi:hypothetical protein